MQGRILRAHSYDIVADVRHHLQRVPSQWLATVGHVGWILLPEDLSPLFTGLMSKERRTDDGRLYSECGGWYCDETCDGDFVTLGDPHIYLDRRRTWAAVHEVAHALEIAWNVPVEDFYQPDNAFDDYMASNSEEYFACALDAFLQPGRDDSIWNCRDLAQQDPELYQYLDHKKEHVR